MLKTLKAYIGEYKKTAISAPIFIVFEVIFEMIIPLLMAAIIDNGLETGNMKYVITMGLVMLLISFASLFCGSMAAKQAAIASTGFAKNVREGMYNHIQEFSFSNIDHFSTAGLVTRLTTDVTNVQNAFQMMMRMLMRAPVMLVTAMTMTNCPRTILNAVLCNKVLSVMSLRLMSHEIRHQRLRIFSPENQAWNRTFKLVYHKNKFLTPAIYELEKLLRQYPHIELPKETGALISAAGMISSQVFCPKA